MQITKLLLAHKKRLFFWFLLGWMVAVLLLSLVDIRLEKKPPVAHADKWVHTFMYGTMAVLTFFYFSYGSKFQHRFALYLVSFVVPFAYGMIIEILQAVLPVSRDGDVLDLLANSTGIIISLLLIFWFSKIKIQKKQK